MVQVRPEGNVTTELALCEGTTPFSLIQSASYIHMFIPFSSGYALQCSSFHSLDEDLLFSPWGDHTRRSSLLKLVSVYYYLSVTGLKSNYDQSRAGLDFIEDFVEIRKVDAGQIVLIIPSEANFEIIRKLRPNYPTLGSQFRIDNWFFSKSWGWPVVVLRATKFTGAGFLNDSGH